MASHLTEGVGRLWAEMCDVLFGGSHSELRTPAEDLQDLAVRQLGLLTTNWYTAPPVRIAEEINRLDVGGGAPESLWSADFENGVYTIGGSPATYEDILDPESGFGTGNLDPGVGVKGAGSVVPALAAPTLASGGSFVAEVDFGYNEGVGFFALTFFDGTIDISYAVMKETVGGGGNGGLFANQESLPVAEVTVGVHTLRMTIESDNVAVSVDGGVVETLAPAPSSAFPFGFVVIQDPSNIILKSLVCYEPVANNELPTLPGLAMT